MERMKRVNKQRKISALFRVIFATLITAALLVVIWVSVGRAMDSGIDNQNVMNCKSAEVSLNAKWLDKCEQYYETGEYEYLRYSR